MTVSAPVAHPCLNSGVPASKDDAIAGLQAVCAVFRDLYGFERVCVKVQSIAGTACPRFHVDNVVLRALCTYCGPGTEYLPPDASTVFGDRVLRTNGARACSANAGDVLFLKGIEEHRWRPAAVHRSPLSEEPRLLLIVDNAVDSLRYFLRG